MFKIFLIACGFLVLGFLLLLAGAAYLAISGKRQW